MSVPAVELTKVLDLHKKVTRAERIHLRADSGRLLAVSGTNSGLVLGTALRTKEDVRFIACVDRESFAGVVRGSGDVNLIVRDGRLVMSGKGLRGDVPSVVEEPPKIPRPDKVSSLGAADRDFLRGALSKVRLSALDREGLLSVFADGKAWSVECSDNVHGAFAFGRSSSNIRFGLFPADVDVLHVLLSDTGDTPISIGTFENVLVVSTGAIRATIPVTEPSVTDPDVVRRSGKAVATLDASDLRDVLSAIAPLAAARDASAVKFILGGRISIAISSPSGSVRKIIVGESRASQEFGLSHRLLSDVAARLEEKVVVLTVADDKGVITQVNFRSGGAYYSLLTSE